MFEYDEFSTLNWVNYNREILMSFKGLAVQFCLNNRKPLGLKHHKTYSVNELCTRMKSRYSELFRRVL